MKKKILALLLVFALLFACVSIPANAEGEPEASTKLSYTEDVSVVISKDLSPSTEDFSEFSVQTVVDTSKAYGLDGADKDNYTSTITSYKAQRAGGEEVVFNPDAPEEFVNVFYFAEGEEKVDITLTATVENVFNSTKLFGEVSYIIGVMGFGTEPIIQQEVIEDFPTVTEAALHTAPAKVTYSDAETPELDGIALVATTSAGAKGVISYEPSTQALFTTTPKADERLTFGTTELIINFSGIEIAVPVTVVHSWSNPPAPHAYSDADKGSHVEDVCAVCSETNVAGEHVVDPNGWVVNNDVQPDGRATASQTCKDCGCVLTKNVLVFNEKQKINVKPEQVLSAEGLLNESFGVNIELDNSNAVAIDGSSLAHSYKITSISAQTGAAPREYYNKAYPDPFLNVFSAEDKPDIVIDVEFQIIYDCVEVFGNVDYTITVKGFSGPPDLGIEIPGVDLGGVAVLPVDISEEFTITNFPSLSSFTGGHKSNKKFYTDEEKPELTGVSVNVTTSLGITGTVTYSAVNDHAFTTIPAKDQQLTVDTKEIATFFMGQHIEPSLPIQVEHAWSALPVSITTDKYSDSKPGYHAYVCNGCGEAHTAEAHTPDADNWKSNEDQSFVANGTESTTCTVCGATLTRDVFGTADYNNIFANYHFLRVIFDYINLLLRIISGAGIN